MNRMIGLSILSAVTLAACSSEGGIGSFIPPEPSGEARPLRNVEQTDIITQVTTPKVDILYVIDNSGSMREEQDALTENFPIFIDYFLGSGLDYHVGVTSTDMDERSGNNGTKGKLRNFRGLRWLDRINAPSEADAKRIFTQMAAMGTTGSPTEKGLAATYAALELERDEANAGFYRDEASIHTIIVSDEPNDTRGRQEWDIPINEFIAWYDNLKKEAGDRTFSAIINERGGDYRSVLNQIGGIEADIGGNFRVVLDRLGVQASGLKREYFLSQRPVQDTIVVSVEQPIEGNPDNVNVLAFEAAEFDEKGDVTNPADAFTYAEGRNSITFVEFIPESLSRVVITYDLLAATQENDLVEEEPDAGSQ